MSAADPRDALRRACAESATPSEEARIALGQTAWFRGKPAPAVAGTVAILTETGLTVIANEADVLKVEQRDDLFLIQLRGEANILVRFERVIKARTPPGAKGGCGCGPKAGDETGGDKDGGKDSGGGAPIARRLPMRGGFGGFGGRGGNSWFPDGCVTSCEVVTICQSDPDAGWEFCIPYLICDTTCFPLPVPM